MIGSGLNNKQKMMIRMVKMIFAPLMILLLLAGCNNPAGFLPRVLVITGGHSYDTTEFHTMLHALGNMKFDTISHPRARNLLASDQIFSYDVVLFYDYQPELPEKDSSIYLNLVQQGVPLLFMHHSICSFQRWEGFKQIVGGKYIMEGYASEDDGVSDYRHDLDLQIRIAESTHPVITGIEDFEIHDEGYSNVAMTEGIIPLLETDNPDCSSPVAWINPHEASKIIGLMLGHDKLAYANPSLQHFIGNSIEWLAGDE